MTAPEYSEGAAAATAGVSILTCPYPMGRNRREWLRGYFSVRPAKPDGKSSSHRRQAKR